MEIKTEFIRGSLGKVPCCVSCIRVSTAGFLPPTLVLLNSGNKAEAALPWTQDPCPQSRAVFAFLGTWELWPPGLCPGPHPPTQSSPASPFGHLGTHCPLCVTGKADLLFPLGQRRSTVHNSAPLTAPPRRRAYRHVFCMLHAAASKCQIAIRTYHSDRRAVRSLCDSLSCFSPCDRRMKNAYTSVLKGIFMCF